MSNQALVSGAFFCRRGCKVWHGYIIFVENLPCRASGVPSCNQHEKADERCVVRSFGL